MLRLIHLGLKRQGLPPLDFKPPKSVHIPITDKRDILHNLKVTHGPLSLLKIGDAVKDAPHEPMLTALLLARDTHDLIARWQRLERFVHSRHRTQILSEKPNSIILRHYAYKGSVAPRAEEDLLIFGLLIALIEKIGATNVNARVVGMSTWVRAHKIWRQTNIPQDVSTWEISWTPTRPTTTRTATPSPDATDWLKHTRQILEADPGRHWTLETLAQDLLTSRRTLQRRLTKENSSFSSVLAEVRMAIAADLLSNSKQTPSEIGYACGFADQAHFSREFKRFTAFTPATFRDQFKPN